ncbi:ArsR/SmtB family transcription factor [Paenibacillus allorhizosphaerae]|uniref:HTH arsR-type domain-containing protein n=1 Tax=Paenibacillus allorhizosphaerae TaxID=2849866 RepID=A0ABM8VN40_9BACL|nr:helix-turn-helix domain-containing protein [Paenibacillus allorhizosphaerae]CAG7650543.1 hypothetical protein PAECIP111802_04747 [Paenibacillus allorhizosphaerae]
MSQVLSVNIDELAEIAKALSSELRIEIFKAIQKKRINVNEIAEMFDLPASTATVNVKKLEEAKLIRTELIPGIRGSQKVCSALYDRMIVDFGKTEKVDPANYQYISMPIGHYVDCDIIPTCGLASETGLIGFYDDPRSFYEPDKVNAQILWFRQGFVEYRFPNKIPFNSRLTGIEVSMELCSEAPLHNKDYPSDITVWINGIELGTWMSPGDFGGERGLLTPAWWETHVTQYGVLKKWKVTTEGTFIDGSQVSNLTVGDLDIDGKHSFSLCIGIKPDAVNQGGINLFGRRFGNYDQDILLRMDYEPKKRESYSS